MTGIDLSTSYLGLDLRSPVVASPSPRNADLDHLRALQRAGVGAVVLPSLFEEQIAGEQRAIDDMLWTGAEGFGEASSFFPELPAYRTGPDPHLDLVASAVAALDVPVVASLNGATVAGWGMYAKLLEEAGAAAVEMNTYRVAADPGETGLAVEDEVVAAVAAVRAAVRIPVAVKVGPYYSALANVADRLAGAGADGLVLFNRFYQPDLDLETLEATPHLVLSSSEELRLPLRWIGLLSGRVRADLAASTGVHTWEDVAKVLLAGASVAMTTSAVLRHGPGHVTTLLDGLRGWMAERDYDSVRELQGSAAWATGPNPDGFERANYLAVISSYAPTSASR